MNLSYIKNLDFNLYKNQLVMKIFKVIKMLEIKNKYKLDINRDENNELIECINSARKEWTNANINFEFAMEDEIIDYYAYKIKAYQSKYNYLLKKAKDKGIKLNYINMI